MTESNKSPAAELKAKLAKLRKAQAENACCERHQAILKIQEGLSDIEDKVADPAKIAKDALDYVADLLKLRDQADAAAEQAEKLAAAEAEKRARQEAAEAIAQAEAEAQAAKDKVERQEANAKAEAQAAKERAAAEKKLQDEAPPAPEMHQKK